MFTYHLRKGELPFFLESSPYTSLLNAIKQGKCIFSEGHHFKAYQFNNKVYLKNAYELSHPLFIQETNVEVSEKNLALAFIPPVIRSWTEAISIKPKHKNDVNFWQYPCITEKQAFANHCTLNLSQHINHIKKEINTYLPLPWATYIDKKTYPITPLRPLKSLIKKYKALAKIGGYQLKVHSVCQHVHWQRLLKEARGLGITDLHLSHKDSQSYPLQKSLGFNIRLHGWSLVAVNYLMPERNKGMERKPIKQRKLLASFIGAYLPHYRDDSRLKLFKAAEFYKENDVYIDLADEWHFKKIVYNEQVISKKIESHHLNEHQQQTEHYNRLLSDSKFSLCPIGAGSNTLRFWESIAIGSIPVLFSDDLAIFQETEIGQALLQQVIFWDKEINSELFNYLAHFEIDVLEKKQQKLMAIYEKIASLTCF